jgi:hypothetical protein
LSIAALLTGDSWQLVDALDDQLDPERGGVTPVVASLRAADVGIECGISRGASDSFWRDVADACNAATEAGRLLSLITLEKYQDARDLAGSVRAAASCHYFTLVHIATETCPSSP